MKKLLLLTLLNCLALFAIAQHTVSGLIQDKNDATLLLEGVSVYIPELNKTDISKEGGTYILKNVGIGVMHIRFSKDGYRSEVRCISTQDSAFVLNIELERSILESQEVSYTGFYNNFSSTTPLPVSVYSSNELVKKGSADQLFDLTYKPGIEVSNAGLSNARIAIRGASLNRVAYYSEGIKLENFSDDDKYSPGLNFDGVKNIEVVRGPSALLYGANASGGALILREEQAENSGKRSGNVRFKFNSNTLGAEFGAGIKGSYESGYFYSLRFGLESYTSYIQGAGEEKKVNTEERPFASNSRFRTSDVKVTLGMNKKWGMSKISFSHLNRKNGTIVIPENISTLSDGTEREREIITPYTEVSSDVLGIQTIYFNRRSKFDLSLSYQSKQRKDFTNDFFNVERNSEIIKSPALNYNLKYISDATKKIGLVVGTQGGTNKNTNSGLISRFNDAKRSSLGTFIIFDYKLSKWNFLAGGRFDEITEELYNYKGSLDTSSSRPVYDLKSERSFANGSLGIVFHPTNKLNFKLNVSTGCNEPSVIEQTVFARHQYLRKFETGNPELKLERNFHGEFSALIEFSSVYVELNAYSNQINNYVHSYYSGVDTIVPIDSNSVDTIGVYKFRQAEAEINGAEISVIVNPPSLNWLKLELSYSMIQGKFKSGRDLPFMPTDKLVAALTFEGDKLNYVYKPYLTIAARNYFEEKNALLSDEIREGYLLLDLNLGGSFRWGKQYFDLRLCINNIIDTKYFDQLSYLTELGNTGVSEMGRNISLQMNIPFGLNSK